MELFGKLDLRPFLQATAPLEEYEAAWRLCREWRVLKVILEADAEFAVLRGDALDAEATQTVLVDAECRTAARIQRAKTMRDTVKPAR